MSDNASYKLQFPVAVVRSGWALHPSHSNYYKQTTPSTVKKNAIGNFYSSKIIFHVYILLASSLKIPHEFSQYFHINHGRFSCCLIFL